MRILILTVTAGEGHNSMSNALKAYLNENYPNDEVIVYDMYKEHHKLSGWTFNGMHFKMLQYFPHLMRLNYKLTLVGHADKYNNNSVNMGLIAKKEVLALINEFKPDAIATMHTFAAALMNNFRRNKLISEDIKVYTIISDYSPHPDCESNTVFKYVFTPCEEIHDFLISHKGFNKEQLIPTGIPIHPKFDKEFDVEGFAKEKGIDTSKFTVFIFSGGMSIGNNHQILKQVSKAKCFKDINVIIVNGKNKKVKNKIDKFVEKGKYTNIFNYGFSREVEKFMHISTCMIGKLGGVGVSEAFSKNLPILVPFKPPFHEYWNMLFLDKQKAIKVIDGLKKLSPVIDELYNNPQELDELNKNVQRLKKPNATKDMADLIHKNHE